MIKLLKIREFMDNGVKKKARTPLKEVAEIASVPEMFLNAKDIADKIPTGERFNIHYSLAHWGDKNGKEFDHQEVIPFDLDDIALDRIDEYVPIVCNALGVDESKVAIIHSGNGLHVIIWTTNVIYDPHYFEETRPYYKEMCRKIGNELFKRGLSATVDTSLWCTGKSLRFPYTKNIKADKGEKECVLVNGYMEAYDYNIVEKSGLPAISHEEQVSDIVFKYDIDTEEVLKCPFIQHCIDDAETITEPEWFAMLSVVCRLDKGDELCHEFSMPYPTYDRAECQSKIDYTLSATRPRTCSNIATLWDGCADCPHNGKISSPIVLKGAEHIGTESTGFYNIVTDQNGIEKRGKPNYEDLVKKFIQIHEYKIMNDTLFLYTGKYWKQEQHRLYPDMFAERWFDPKPVNSMCIEFKNKLLRNPERYIYESFFDMREYVNFNNGVLELETGELHEHSTEFGFNYVLPFDYDRDAECPVYDNFISSICSEDEELVQLMNEWVGFVACNADLTIDPKAMILTGDGANGKSTFAEMLTSLCGEGNYSGVSIGEAVRKPEARADMFGKMLNVSEEVPENALMDNSVFKNLVTGGIMTARKLYKDTISIQNKTKIIMTCNRLPTNFDSSYGAKRRLLIIELQNRYCRENGNLDTQLKHKLRKELAGIWNRGYVAFLEMKKRGGFIDVESVRRTVDEFSIADNPVANWIIDNDEYELGDGEVMTGDAYSSFNMWAAQNGYARRYIPTKTKFTRDLRHLYGVNNKVIYRDGKSVRVYTGLRIKESEDEVQTQAV